MTPARPGTPQTANPSQIIYDGLIARGFNPAQAAALVGNMQQESAFSTGANNPGEGAYGLIQWRQDRLDDLKAFAAARGKPTNDLDTQLDFIKYEMAHKEAARSQDFLAASDVATANAALVTNISAMATTPKACGFATPRPSPAESTPPEAEQARLLRQAGRCLRLRQVRRRSPTHIDRLRQQSKSARRWVRRWAAWRTSRAARRSSTARKTNPRSGRPPWARTSLGLRPTLCLRALRGA